MFWTISLVVIAVCRWGYALMSDRGYGKMIATTAELIILIKVLAEIY